VYAKRVARSRVGRDQRKRPVCPLRVPRHWVCCDVTRPMCAAAPREDRLGCGLALGYHSSCAGLALADSDRLVDCSDGEVCWLERAGCLARAHRAKARHKGAGPEKPWACRVVSFAMPRDGRDRESLDDRTREWEKLRCNRDRQAPAKRCLHMVAGRAMADDDRVGIRTWTQLEAHA
jgi:hypothetical protein